MLLQIAGAAAAEGLSLQEVAAAAKEAADQCRSVGVATRICTLPGASPSDRLTVHTSIALALLLISIFICGSSLIVNLVSYTVMSLVLAS